MSDLSQILDRMRRVPLGTLVAELRELHESGGGAARATPPRDQAPGRGDASADGVASRGATRAAGDATTARDATAALAPPAAQALEPLAALVGRAAAASAGAAPLAARRASAVGPLARPSSRPASDQDDDAWAGLVAQDRYALLRRHFGEQETQLRRQAQLSDRILSQLERGEVASAAPRATPLQQEIRVLCPAGGRSGARAVLRNELRRPVVVELRVHPPRGADPIFDGIQVTCEPRTLELAPDEEHLVRIAVDATGSAPAAAGQLELVVDALVDDAIVQKIWVAVLVLRAPSTAVAGTCE